MLKTRNEVECDCTVFPSIVKTNVQVYGFTLILKETESVAL